MVASILGAAQAQGANWIGNQTLLGGDFNTSGNVNEFAHEFAHAIVGCAAGAAGASAAGSGTSTGQGCGAGALGAVVGDLSAQFYGGTDPNKTIAFAQMMGGIAAAAAGLGAEGVSIAANTGANAAQNNYMSHYDTYEADLKSCQQNPGGVNCGAILSLTKGTDAHYLGMTQGGYRVAANMGKDGAASYTVVSPNGETMVMQPTEWAYFSRMTSGQQATIFAGSQWQLDLTSATEYGLSGNTTAAMANYAHMLTQPDYWVGMGAAFLPAGVLGRAATATTESATFEGTLYRSVGEGYDPLLIHPGNVAASHRYTGPGQGGLYLSTGKHVVESELVNNGISLSGKQMHTFSDSQIPGLLDLSNPKVRENLGISLSDLTRTGGTQAWRYEVTQPLGQWAQQNGYRGVIAPSAQADGGLNIILFDSKVLK